MPSESAVENRSPTMSLYCSKSRPLGQVFWGLRPSGVSANSCKVSAIPVHLPPRLKGRCVRWVFNNGCRSVSLDRAVIPFLVVWRAPGGDQRSWIGAVGLLIVILIEQERAMLIEQAGNRSAEKSAKHWDLVAQIMSPLTRNNLSSIILQRRKFTYFPRTLLSRKKLVTVTYTSYYNQ